MGLAEYQEGKGKGWGSLLGHGEVSTQSYTSYELSTGWVIRTSLTVTCCSVLETGS